MYGMNERVFHVPLKALLTYIKTVILQRDETKDDSPFTLTLVGYELALASDLRFHGQ